MAETEQNGLSVEEGDTEELVMRVTAEKGGREISVTRVLDAPISMVWTALTDPSMIQRWWGPKSLSTTVEKFEARQGGIWRIIQRDPNGKEFGFHGVFHELVPNERVVQTIEFEGTPGHVALQTDTIEERSMKTVVNTVSVFQSPEDRDGMLSSDMETGLRESTERLAILLDELLESEGKA